jgi:hypothetical protein
MRGERWLLRVGEFLVGRAARHLPAAAREERCREWAAELPAILGDPQIKPAAARAARMLWFAADTVRGAALGPGPARHKGAHRGRAGLKNARQSALWLGQGVALLAVLAVLLAGLAFQVYQVIVVVSLAGYAAFVLSSPAALAVWLLLRRPGGAGWFWSYAGVMAAAAGGGAARLAGQLGWGHPLLFTLIAACGYTVCAACISVAGAIMIRRDGRPGMQERSDREQLRGPRPFGGCGTQPPIGGGCGPRAPPAARGRLGVVAHRPR